MTNVPQIVPNRRSEVKENIVTTKFNESSEFAREFYELVKTYVEEITNIAKEIPDIKTKIVVPPVDFSGTDTRKLEELLRNFPKDPLTNVDWPNPPTDHLEFSEDTNYTDELFEMFDTKLQSILNSATTLLNSGIENQILSRESERDLQTNQDTIAAKSAEWAKRGVELPSGGLFSDIGQVQLDYQNTLLTKSRDIAVESKKTEITNMQKVLEDINQFEATRMQFKSGYWQRKLDAAKALLERGTYIFTAQIEVIKAKAITYQALCTAYSYHAGALSELIKASSTIVMARIEKAKLDVDAQVQELLANIKEIEVKYGVTMDGAKTQGLMASQIIASALSAVSASAHIASSDSASIDANLSSSESWNHNIDESP